jgi:hypothetical protein
MMLVHNLPFAATLSDILKITANCGSGQKVMARTPPPEKLGSEKTNML